MVDRKLKSLFQDLHPGAKPKGDFEEKRYRLNAFYDADFCTTNFPNGYEELYRFVQDAPTFAQGNEPVETGFSVIGNMLQDNMH